MTKTKFTKEQKEVMSAIGRIGGKNNVKKHGKKHMRELGKAAAEKRWSKQKDTKIIK